MSQEKKEPRGLIHNRKFLQYSFIFLLAGVALLFHFMVKAMDERASLRKYVAQMEAKRVAMPTLMGTLEGKPEELRRGVLLSFLKVIYPEADGVEEKRLPEIGIYFEVRKGGDVIGYAGLYVEDIDCAVCDDIEIFVGLDLSGKIVGFSAVKGLDHAPHARGKVSDALKQYLGKSPADRQKISESFQSVAGATKTSKGVKDAVLDVLLRLKPVLGK